MRDIYYVEDLEQLKVLSEPLRIKILWELDSNGKTGKMIADKLELPPSKVRYHLKELEKAGFIQIEKTEEKNGIMQKFYRTVARMISLEKIIPKVNREKHDLDDIFKENALAQLEKMQSKLRQTETIDWESDLQWFEEFWLTKDELGQLKEKMREVSSLAKDFHKDYRKDDAEKYYVSTILLPVTEDDE